LGRGKCFTFAGFSHKTEERRGFQRFSPVAN
jgi:hypothetical protein